MYFDVAMPAALFAITIVALLLNEKVEEKLKATFEKKELKTSDALLLVVAISIMVSVIVFVPQAAIVTVFLFAYSLLLFTFAYILSDTRKKNAILFFAVFALICLLTALASFLIFGLSGLRAYGFIVLCCLCVFSALAIIYERRRENLAARWYLAALPPALFLTLYIFYGETTMWFPYLLNFYGAIFAILIILYIGHLFRFETTLIFVSLLTAVDILLVLVTGTMVSAATRVSELKLPVLITMPTIPRITTQFGTIYMSLGLGDFFFAGLLALQTLKKFGKLPAVISALTMALSFFIFEMVILNFRMTAFPGTLMIICGWLPALLYFAVKMRVRNFPEG